ncbi:MAG: GNAT family N-acetyltransferase [Acidimicrobiales bacterium]|nr:GNAT family N-acetyltransferase [Acidimicrobiales bacterium]HRW38453.1 GNAT family N-acetyltransferase [Aquihabitans sp.]
MAGEGWGEPWVFPLPWPPLADPRHQIALRPWGAGEHDAAALARAWADPEVARHTSVPHDATEEAARRWIRGEEERRAKGLAIDLVVTSVDRPAEIVGEVGLIVVEPDEQWAELGYWLFPDARGRGAMASAVGLFADWVLRELPVRRLFARTHPDNERAGKVAAAAGLAHAGTLDTGTLVWIRDRPGR